MVQALNNITKQPRVFEEQRTATAAQPRTVVIAYEQPKVVVVRQYSKTIVPHVNPEDYRRRFNAVLLDTSTLLALTRRLNIQDSEVRCIHPIKHDPLRSSIDFTASLPLNRWIVSGRGREKVNIGVEMDEEWLSILEAKLIKCIYPACPLVLFSCLTFVWFHPLFLQSRNKSVLLFHKTFNYLFFGSNRDKNGSDRNLVCYLNSSWLLLICQNREHRFPAE